MTYSLPSLFAGRLVAEAAIFAGGLPAAAAEIGVAPQIIEAIANAEPVSAVDLMRVYAWLSSRVVLSPQEHDDFRRIYGAVPGTPSLGVPPALPPAPTGPGSQGSRGWSRREVAFATVTLILIIALTVVITVVIVKPGPSTAAADSTASPTVAPEPTTEPTATASGLVPGASASATALGPTSSGNSSPAFPPTSSAPEGQLIASYNNFKLSVSYSIDFAAGGPPVPTTALNSDLIYFNSNNTEFDEGNGGGIALFTGAASTFTDCKQDTALGGEINSVVKGDTICFQGHGVVAAAYVANLASSGGVSYATLDVRVWQDPSQSAGT